MKNEQYVVVGAGLVGSLISVLLRQQGAQVKIFEKRKDQRHQKEEEGRSINLALSHRGLRALDMAGLKDAVEPYLVPMRGRMMHDTDGHLNFQPYGREDQHINSVSRKQLNMILLEAAEKAGIEIIFDAPCQRFEVNESILHFENHEPVQAEYVIGADGAFSVIRDEIMRTRKFNYSQQFLDHDYKELTIPPTPDGDYALHPGTLHIWPRGGFMLIALPNIDRSFTATLFYASEGKSSFAQLNTPQKVHEFFEKEFPDVIPIMPELTDEFFKNPTASLVTIFAYPWSSHAQRAVLIGDAAHAIVPFYGQGMNAGFEDCRIFMEILEQHQHDFPAAVAAYEKSRKDDADAIAHLALQNFVEMRDRVGDERFLKRKKLEARLQEHYPDIWTPLYSMVTFSDTPYAKALETGRKQQRIMDELASDEILENWDSAQLEPFIERFQNS